MHSGRPAPRSKDAFEIIVRVLAPYLGENMARAAVRGHREKLGITQSQGQRRDVDRLMDALGPGLGVFVGRDKTAAILREMRAELEEAGTVL